MLQNIPVLSLPFIFNKLVFLEFFFYITIFLIFFLIFFSFSLYCYFSTKKYLNFFVDNDFFLLTIKNILNKFFIFLALFLLCAFYLYFYYLANEPFKFTCVNNLDAFNDFFFFNSNTDQFCVNIYSFLILFLCLFTGVIALSTISNVYEERKSRLYIIFLQFLLTVFGFVTANDLIFFFFFYELLLLGSFLIVYYGSYIKKSTQASIFFVIWTQLGSLLVLLSISYIYYVSNTTNFFLLKFYPFSSFDCWIIYTLLFFGFGFKLPIWPFHYWLTKTHVEALSGFSIYLSGFLVKTALFGFYKINSFINFEINTNFFLAFLIVGAIDASIKMWGQTDLKKLVAYCTIQEMNLIAIFFLKGDSSIVFYGFVFNFTHAFLSTLMFYLVECIYVRYYSRSVFLVNGIFFTYPGLGFVIFLMTVIFSGIPGTFKFICEFFIFNTVLNFSWVLCIFLIFFVNVLGLIGFSKNWLNAIFCAPSISARNLSLDLSKKELVVISLNFFFLILFSYINIFIF